jgi:hypothetical protein
MMYEIVLLVMLVVMISLLTWFFMVRSESHKEEILKLRDRLDGLYQWSDELDEALDFSRPAGHEKWDVWAKAFNSPKRKCKKLDALYRCLKLGYEGDLTKSTEAHVVPASDFMTYPDGTKIEQEKDKSAEIVLPKYVSDSIRSGGKDKSRDRSRLKPYSRNGLPGGCIANGFRCANPKKIKVSKRKPPKINQPTLKPKPTPCKPDLKRGL